MKLSIVIPHHNGKKLIFECLESLFRNTSIKNFETIVVDNLYTDNSIGILYEATSAEQLNQIQPFVSYFFDFRIKNLAYFLCKMRNLYFFRLLFFKF